jgi:hypothetical protein
VKRLVFIMVNHPGGSQANVIDGFGHCSRRHRLKDAHEKNVHAAEVGSMSPDREDL